MRNEHIRGIAQVEHFGLDTCRGGTVNTLVEGCSKSSLQAEGKDEIHGRGERGYRDS